MSASIVLHSFMLQFPHIQNQRVGTKIIEAKRVSAMMNHSLQHDPKATTCRQKLIKLQFKFQQVWVKFLSGLPLKHNISDISKHHLSICQQITDMHAAPDLMFKVHRLDQHDLKDMRTLYDSLVILMQKSINHN